MNPIRMEVVGDNNVALVKIWGHKNTGDGSLYPYKGFRKKMGTGFTFCLALNARGQKKTVPILKLLLQEHLLNARRVPFFAFQFSKNRQLRPLFLAYFCLPKIMKPL
jgi:hypothetical protein